MASILDAGFLGVFTGILIFLLVYAVIWGFLSWRHWFSTGPNAIAAFVIALLVTITPAARYFISFVTPWYVMLGFVIFFILFIMSMFGLSPEHDFAHIISDARVYTWIIIFAVIIFLFGLGNTFGQGITPGGGPTPSVTPQDPGLVVIGGQQYAQPGQLAPDPYAPGYYGQGSTQAGMPGSTATNDFGANMLNTIFHPKVLGLIVTFLIASVSVFFLSSK